MLRQTLGVNNVTCKNVFPKVRLQHPLTWKVFQWILQRELYKISLSSNRYNVIVHNISCDWKCTFLDLVLKCWKLLLLIIVKSIHTTDVIQFY
jgi:hypothetical protein